LGYWANLNSSNLENGYGYPSGGGKYKGAIRQTPQACMDELIKAFVDAMAYY
jgi:hypothetical protein